MTDWSLILDPSEVADARVELPLNVGAIRIDQKGLDWGDAGITAYMADLIVGSAPVDYRIPNRAVTVPLFLGADESGTFDLAREQLRQKVALLQREGGWLKRQDADGNKTFADIVNATLHLPDVWGETGGLEPDVTLTLECLPDFYGDEITLDAVTATPGVRAVLTQSGPDAVIKGDHPARVRVLLTEESGNDQKSVILGFRSRHYDSAATAALAIEAEAMTPASAASVNARAGASGSNTVLSPLAKDVWVPVLTTDLISGGELTHAGSYRVWCRLYSNSSPLVRLIWGIGDVSHYQTNPSVAMPDAPNQFFLVNLGEIRIDPTPDGSHKWRGLIQCMAVGSDADTIEADVLYFQPVDENSCVAIAVQEDLTSVTFDRNIEELPSTGSSGDHAATASFVSDNNPWSNPTVINDVPTDGFDNPTGTARCLMGSSLSGGDPEHGVNPPDAYKPFTTQYLYAKGLGFSVPSDATILGFLVEVNRWNKYEASQEHSGFPSPPNPFTIPPYVNGQVYVFRTRGPVTDGMVGLVKAGQPDPPENFADTSPWPNSPAPVFGPPGFPADPQQWKTYGSSSELWGQAWSPGDVNDPNFGLKLYAKNFGGEVGTVERENLYNNTLTSVIGHCWFYSGLYWQPVVNAVRITVYYRRTIASGIDIPEDAVLHATRTAEFRSDGVFHDDSTGSSTIPAAMVRGDLPRLPPSGLEDRVVELFVRPSRSDLDVWPDEGLDSLRAQVVYRPCYLGRS